MEVIKIQKGKRIAKRKDKVKEWYLIQSGSVIQKFGFAEIVLGQNAIIGIIERDWFICDYITKEDTAIVAIPCKNADDLKSLLAANERYRIVFLKTAIEQRHRAFVLYTQLQKRVSQFHAFVQTVYNDYQTFCSSYQLDEQVFPQIDYFNMLEMKHKAEAWEVNNSISLIQNVLKEYIQMMVKDDSLCVGVIMEAAAQMHRVMLGIGEMVTYLSDHKEILLSESENDIFHLYFDLAVRCGKRHLDIAPVRQELSFLSEFIRKIQIYEPSLIKERIKQYEEYDFENAASAQLSKKVDVLTEDCLKHIMDFGQIGMEEADAFKKQVEAYRSLPDMTSTDSAAYKIRKQLAPPFYEIYFKVFMQMIENEDEASPIIEMFLNFGFMDTKMAGEENAKALYDLTGRLRQFKSDRVYTIYTWLRSIYFGRNEPSKNEFELDYLGYLLEQRKNGDLTEEQVKKMQNDQKEKVRFEIQNMFSSANRITYGKITTFCPILCEYDLINTIDKMAVTVERLEEELNKIRKIDFSAFYREVNFTNAANDILSHEMLMKEVLPDIILMPNAGTRAMMWQETADKRRDTKARFLFPIFTAASLEDMMVETVARYRWEMCRKIQGVRWNDIREKSLTSEYCDYLQFYRKNRDLSADAKDKLKTAIQRAKNNYREVFVKDYQGWISYESKGSFRLNKVAREILIVYCPFAKEIRTALKINPMYQISIPKFERDAAKKEQRLTALYDKYQKAGGEITEDLKDNLLYCQL
ncbi:MAG: cyclic nucleotide-binding domain-containing protein [Eubacterium sp.]|nr:cyclic nucleotide-binding domain-containing protein [Eubacterium sp.]